LEIALVSLGAENDPHAAEESRILAERLDFCKNASVQTRAALLVGGAIVAQSLCACENGKVPRVEQDPAAPMQAPSGIVPSDGRRGSADDLSAVPVPERQEPVVDQVLVPPPPDPVVPADIVEEGCLAFDAELDETLLVVLLDVGLGSSAGGDAGTSRASTLASVTAGLASFFNARPSVGVRVALTLFPKPAEASADAGSPLSCDERDYASFDVPFQALPSDAFGAALDDAVLVGLDTLATPTHAALSGTYEATLGALAGGPVANATVVLITDEKPTGCGSEADDVAVVAEAITRVAANVQTAVVVIDAVANGTVPSALELLAKAGGVRDAYRIATSDDGATATLVEEALEDVNARALRCEVSFPELPGGDVVDPDRLNVTMFWDGSPETYLFHDPGCVDALAWHYDDPEAPQKIVLCPETCRSWVAGEYPGAKLQVLFGCPLLIREPD
jgi:hypothetical protein